MGKKGSGGRPVIYGPKNGNREYRVLALTKDGQRGFEAARKALRKSKDWPRDVSDADVIDFLVRRYNGMEG